MVDPIPLEATDWAALQTPCFVLDEPELRANFADFDRALKQAWSPLARVAYSVKTNPFWWILDMAREEGCMAEVVSGDEFSLALERGFAPTDVVFNGPIKTRDWLEWALARGAVVNLDAASDVAWTCAWARKHPGCPVGVRANIELERHCPGETLTGDSGGRFGFCWENGELARVVAELRAAGADVCGLHMHVTTRSRSQHVYQVLAEHAALIARELGIRLRWVDMGGGYYGGGRRNEGAYERYAATMAQALRGVADPASCALYVEPGGAVVCTPGRYAGKVLDVKDTTANRFVTCELSRINVDHEMKKTRYPLHIVGPDGRPLPDGARPAVPSQVLCGFTCMESDRLCVLADAPELARGDTLVVDFAGAYSMSFTPGMFICHPPAVYARAADGSCRLLRALASPGAPASAEG